VIKELQNTLLNLELNQTRINHTHKYTRRHPDTAKH